MGDGLSLDALFQQAVCLIDAGDVAALERMLAANPRLARERLDAPGAWLRDKVGSALDDFFCRPYLLWFVAEDPIRTGRLPSNIADVARTITAAARRAGTNCLQEQVDYALRLVCWSRVARDCRVQIELMDVLIDAGAGLEGRELYGGRFGTHSESAIYNGHLEAAGHLLKRGAALTLSSALCLGRWADVERLASSATPAEKDDAFVLAALNGQAEALRKMLSLGVSPTTVSARHHPHGTALHHAAASGSLEAVRLLVEAGADLSRRDTVYGGTPLGWAEYAGQGAGDPSREAQFGEIAAYLGEQGAQR